MYHWGIWTSQQYLLFCFNIVWYVFSLYIMYVCCFLSFSWWIKIIETNVSYYFTSLTAHLDILVSNIAKRPPTHAQKAARPQPTTPILSPSGVSVIYKAGIPREQFPRRILVTSSPTRPTSSRGCYEDHEDVARVGRVGRLPHSACHALIWLIGRRSAAVSIAARLSVCRVVLQIPVSYTHLTLPTILRV